MYLYEKDNTNFETQERIIKQWDIGISSFAVRLTCCKVDRHFLFALTAIEILGIVFIVLNLKTNLIPGKE